MKTPLPTTLILTVALASLALPVTGYAQASLPAARETPAGANAQNTSNDNDDRIVELSAFIVTSETDNGYLASSAISGTKTNTPLRDLPISIAVITEDVIKDLNLAQATDALAYIGSINVTTQGQSNTPDIGLNFDGQLTVRGSGTFYNLRNGFRSYDQPSSIATQRIEVIRGPASVLYGITKPGGVVNFITKLPTFGRDRGRVTASYGSYGTTRSTLDMNFGKFLDDRLAFRLTGSYLENNPYYRYSKGVEEVINPSIAFRPFKDTLLTVEYEYIRRERPTNFSNYFLRGVPGYRSLVPIWYQASGPDDPASLLPVFPGFSPRDLVRGDAQKTFNPVDNLSVNLTQKIGRNLSLNFQYGNTLRENRTKGLNVFTVNAGSIANDLPTSLVIPPETNPPQPFVPQPRFRRQYEEFTFYNDIDNYGINAIYTHDTNLPLVGLVKHKVVMGVSRLEENFRQELNREFEPGTNNRITYVVPLRPDADFGTPAGFPLGEIRRIVGSDAYENNDFESFFASYAGEFFDSRFIINAGITRSLFQQARDTSVPGYIVNFSNNSPLVGAIVRPLPWLGIFVQQSKSFNPNTSARDGFGNFLQPELGDGGEIGLKLDPWQGRLVATLSAFKIKENNRVVNDPNAPNRNSFFINAAGEQELLTGPNDPRYDPDLPNQIKGANASVGQAISEGFDLDVVYSPTRALQFFGSYAYLDAYASRDTNTTIGNRVGRPLPNMVRHRASLLSKYTFTEGRLKGADIVLGVNWRSKIYRDSGNLDNASVNVISAPYDRFADPRWDGNLKLGYRLKLFDRDTDFAFNVSNLFAADNFTGLKPGAPLVGNGLQTDYATAPTEAYYFRTPRTYSFTVGVSF